MPKRDWCPILIDAGLRGLTATEVAQEQGCSVPVAWRASKSWGVLLRNGGLDTKHDRNRAKAAKTLDERRLLYWRRELALAEAGDETLNAFCLRTGKSYTTAEKWAARLGHVFVPTHNGAQRLRKRLQRATETA